MADTTIFYNAQEEHFAIMQTSGISIKNTDEGPEKSKVVLLLH